MNIEYKINFHKEDIITKEDLTGQINTIKFLKKIKEKTLDDDKTIKEIYFVDTKNKIPKVDFLLFKSNDFVREFGFDITIHLIRNTYNINTKNPERMFIKVL